MSGSVFNEPLVEPDEKMLISELGTSYSIYKTIKSEIGGFKDGIQPTWKFYGKKNGWLLKLISGKKNVLFVVPQKKYFRISFTFGESVFEEIMNSSISEKLKNEFFQANKYAEGRTIQLSVDNEEILQDIFTLIHIKMK
jgi:hypothetical protein